MTSNDSSPQSTVPEDEPLTRIRPNRRAVWIAGALDGIVPVVGGAPSILSLQFRLIAVILSLLGVPLVLVEVGGVDSSIVVLVSTAVIVASVLVAFVLTGIFHFELAFGAMEYRLYEDEVVAYDRRLEAIQWRVSINHIDDVTVETGLINAPPWTDAATITLDRVDDDTDEEPYRFFRCSLAYVDDPEEAADRMKLPRSSFL